MSYEGWEQILCKNGHESSANCYEHIEYDEDGPHSSLKSVWKCPVCGAGAVWTNSVNVTNGSYCDNPDCTGNCEWCNHGRIDGFIELEEEMPAEMCTCDKCGSSHIIRSPTYKIPKKGGNRVI